MLAAAIAIYIVLGVLYESFIHPLTILSTLPSAGVGALLALMLFGLRPLGGRAHRHRAADGHRQEERDHDDRLRARGGARSGHVAARGDRAGEPAALPPDHDDDAGGAVRRLPLAFESGTGSELRNPLGITIIGGLLLSQLLTLYTTPVIYLAMERLRTRLTQRAPPVTAVPDRPLPRPQITRRAAE